MTSIQLRILVHLKEAWWTLVMVPTVVDLRPWVRLFFRTGPGRRMAEPMPVHAQKEEVN